MLVVVAVALVLGIGVPLHIGPVAAGVTSGAIVAAVLIPVTVQQIRAARRARDDLRPEPRRAGKAQSIVARRPAERRQ